jgi:hypothetical protein
VAPLPELLTEKAREIVDDWPPFVREEPDFIALAYVFAREAERLDEKAEVVRRQFFLRSADLLLGAWEAQLGITIAPVGATDEERRSLAITFLLGLAATGQGSVWEERLLAAVGAGYAYREHDPDDDTSPPKYTIAITLPLAPSSETFRRAERILRRMTPANTDLLITSTDGFRLDSSQMDQEAFGF